MSSNTNCCKTFPAFLLIFLYVGDVFFDIATGVELILNEHHNWGYAVLGLVALPTVAAILAEVFRVCIYGGCCCCCCCCMDDAAGKFSNWIALLFFHLYTVTKIGGARCCQRWHHHAIYLRCIQGFLQAAPQLVLQTLILFKGIHIHSLSEVVQLLRAQPTFDFNVLWNEVVVAEHSLKWYWGLIQVYSLIFSFVSVIQTCVQFNEWDKRRHTIHRLLLVVPFFAVTILYRTLSITLLLCITGLKITLLPLLALMIAQISTCKNLGLDTPRSFVYGGICSLLAPSGYGRSREPESQPFGISLMPDLISGGNSHGRNATTTFNGRYAGHHEVISLVEDENGDESECCWPCPDDDNFVERGDRTPEQVDMLRDRSRNYLIMHLILGGAIFGISLAILGMFLNFTTAFEPLNPHIIALFGLPTLNDVVFPLIGLTYMTSVVLTGIFSCCIGRCFEEEYIYPV